MKIAMLSPIAWETPPRHYGPWESVVSLLTEGLVERGIDVTLFATADSRTKSRLRAFIPEDVLISDKRRALIRAYFTMEYPTESAALFNPSIVLHPN